MLLQDYVGVKIFRAWSRHSKKTNRLRKQIRERMLTKVIDFWYAKSQENSKYR